MGDKKDGKFYGITMYKMVSWNFKSKILHLIENSYPLLSRSRNFEWQFNYIQIEAEKGYCIHCANDFKIILNYPIR